MGLKMITLSEQERLVIDIPITKSRLLVRINLKDVEVVDDMCRHRSGPLHLCYVDKEGNSRCPWHDRVIRKLERRDEVCAIYRASERVMCLVRHEADSSPWPIKKIGQV